jgi:Polyketide cyclase / dehydrase and lipid transport
MASIHREAIIEASADLVWDALRDVGQVHKRVVPGFLTDCRMEEGARVVTFFNGMVARELIVDVDGKARRLVWAARNERLEHHNASLQVFDIDGLASCRVVWIADVLPHAAAQVVGGLMDEGLACMRKTLGSHSGA